MSFKSPAFGGLELACFRLRNALLGREFPGIARARAPALPCVYAGF
jgi:hypothetical protein